ncbi:glycoside hydrolase family 10 protein [Deinococcus cavernae]|uniref:Glycoside hydrolase family 10 protein n=1 Tax=Deinococcus cavernae TaxID=2320857 RepID=A0A418V054_9DEIO|nr:family 10 glycosylhydrolase [Deinococcus cavernae]RJF69111.1 glycoside hydrolase family 10 protein [Deinococcus cavernae]
MKRTWLLGGALALLSSCAPLQGAQKPQLRGLWVDAFGPGFKTPQEVDRLVADARKMNVNVLFAQVGRRGDCYCNRAAMPRTNDSAVPEGFDPLADLLVKAHAQGLQVHAWIITTALWNSAAPPPDPEHAFNTHGPAAHGRANWLTQKKDGLNRAGADWVLDPGHPDAAEYIRNMYVSVVKNYDVDGIQFDRVRYPDGSPAGGPLEWGYNPTALERYRAETGAVGTPEPGDPQWAAWRRQQVTNLVRETALAVKAVNPRLSVNAATITYGEAPTSEEGFTRSRPYTEVGQDWLTWVKEGYLDVNVMMNYKRDFVPVQAEWFRGWNAFAAQLLRQSPQVAQVSGSAAYLNDQNSSVSQARQALRTGLSGWALYSYRTPDREVNAGRRTQADVWPELSAKFTARTMPFELPAPWPAPAADTLRAVRGSVSGAIPGGREVRLLDARSGEVLDSTFTDGAGRYGFLRVPATQVIVQVGAQRTAAVTIQAGQVVAMPPLVLP